MWAHDTVAVVRLGTSDVIAWVEHQCQCSEDWTMQMYRQDSEIPVLVLVLMETDSQCRCANLRTIDCKKLELDDFIQLE